MFERFTERARQVVVLAQEEARILMHGHIGSEHILLGLLREEEGLAARVLASFDVEIDKVREMTVEIVGKGEHPAEGQIPFTPRGKKIMELALREALSYGHNYIGTEHILLAQVRETEGVAARILRDLSLDPEKVRDETVRVLNPGVAQQVRPTAKLVVKEVEVVPKVNRMIIRLTEPMPRVRARKIAEAIQMLEGVSEVVVIPREDVFDADDDLPHRGELSA